MRNRFWTVAIAGLAVTAFALQSNAAETATKKAAGAMKMADKVTYAVAVVNGLGDHRVKGKVTFTETADGVEIVGEFTGLQPGEHGFHVHEFGDCSMADGKCAGGHFNPTGMPHAGPEDAKRHIGDLGNIKADGKGNASYKFVDKMIKLNGPNSIIGRSIMVHAKPDDFKTQTPPGNAGDRIGCGTIGIGDPKMAAMSH